MKSQSMRAAIGAAALLLALSGCASGSIEGGAVSTDKAGGGPTHVTMGVFTSPAVAVIQLGVDKGFFTDHGIDLKISQAASSAAQLAALSTGDLDYMVASPVTPLLGATQGLGIRIVAGYAQNDPAVVNDSTALVVGAGSPIKRPKELDGKKVSVNALGGVGEIGIRAAVENDGGDPNSIHFVQLALGDVPAQLAAGQIDAGMTGAPWLDKVLASGGKVLSDFIKDEGLGKNELIVAANGKLVKGSPHEVNDFIAALDETYAYANDHHPELAKMLPGLLGIPQAAADHQVWEHYSSQVDVPTLQNFANLMTKYKVVDSKPDVGAIVWKP